MYHCEICKHLRGPRIPRKTIVTKAHKLRRGWKIVEEKNVCPECAEIHRGPIWI